MQVYTFDINRQEEELNIFLEDNASDIKDLHFLEDRAVVVTKDRFDIGEYITSQLDEATDSLLRKQYDLKVLQSYTHLDEDKVKGTLEQCEQDITTLEAKITASKECLARLSEK